MNILNRWFYIIEIWHILQAKVTKNLAISFTWLNNQCYRKNEKKYDAWDLWDLPWGSGLKEAIPPPPRDDSSTKLSPLIPGTSYRLTSPPRVQDVSFKKVDKCRLIKMMQKRFWLTVGFWEYERITSLNVQMCMCSLTKY